MKTSRRDATGRRDAVRPSPRTATVATAALAVVGLAATWLIGRARNPGPVGFPLDDAWIHLVYGRGLAHDGFLAYVPGEPSTGATSPLWAIGLAIFHLLLGGDPAVGTIVPAVLALGGVLHVGVAIAAAALARRVSGDAATGLVAGAMVALAPPLAAAALSGMEVALTGGLLVATVGAAVGGRWTIAGVLLALAGLARPESAAVAGPLALVALVDARSSGAPPAARLARLLGPPALAAAAFAAWNLTASGHPLPATFYAKSQASGADLPRRLGVALGRLLTDVPPLGLGLGWLALAGWWPQGARGAGRAGAVPVRFAVLPLACGAAYLLANLAVVDPVDPVAFYHRRYVLPAVPLLLVGLAAAATRLGRRLPERARVAPLAALAAVALAQTALGAGATSRHLHNDVRNINEVQRRLGAELREALPPGTRIAVSDAGAIRYVSDLPAIDVLGLNTPEMLAGDEAYVASHPVAAIALLPAWFRSPDADRLEPMLSATTDDYTVTGNPRMSAQVVMRPTDDALARSGGRVRVRFVGYRSFALDFVAPEATLGSPGTTGNAPPAP